MTEGLTRRQLLRRTGTAAAAAAAGGLSACSTDSVSGSLLAAQAADSSAGRPFVSRPDLNPPLISVRRHGVPSDPRYIFLNAPYSGPGHGGSYILDQRGQFVWFGPNTAARHRMNVSVQTYQGKPVLTWFQGLVVQGYGKGELVIADSSYTITHIIRAAGGDLADFHDFVITQEGHALITVYRTHQNVDLSAVGGPSKGHLISGVAQEIDIKTGRLVWEWDSIDHVHPVRSHEHLSPGHGTAARPYNYFHINSLAVDADGDLLISGRNTWAVYKVRRSSSGRVLWQLNGKKSHFTMGPGSHFYWQHHVRPHGAGRLTVFDNGAKPVKEQQSRALILHVDAARRHVRLQRAYVHPAETLLAGAMGSAQLLDDGRMFVGWGTEPYFSEFSRDGRLLLDGSITVGDSSYRAFTQDWCGQPAEPPAAAARHRAGGATVYASWNGATEVRSWVVYAGKSRSTLHAIATARKNGFETAIEVSNRGRYFRVQALDGKGRALAQSLIVKIR